MTKPYAALAAVPALLLLAPAPAQAAELLIEPVFSHFDPDTSPDAGNHFVFGFFDPSGSVPRLDTDSPAGTIIYPQTIPVDPILVPDGDPDTFLLAFENNTDYTLTGFTLELVGTAHPDDDADPVFTDEHVIPTSDTEVIYSDGIIDVTFGEVMFGDVGNDGYLGDVFPDVSEDGQAITFSGAEFPMGGVLVNYTLMSLDGQLLSLTDLYPDIRLAIAASFDGVRVPEPAAGGLLLAGLAGIGLTARTRRRKTAGA